MKRRNLAYWERLPLEPLERIINARFIHPDEQSQPLAQFAACFGYSPGTPKRWRESGLTIESADRAACQLGLHPSSIWDEWFDLELGETA